MHCEMMNTTGNIPGALIIRKQNKNASGKDYDVIINIIGK